MIILNHFATSVSWTLFEAGDFKSGDFRPCSTYSNWIFPMTWTSGSHEGSRESITYVSLFVFQAGRRIPWWPCCRPPFFYQQICLFLLVLATDNQVWWFGRTKCILNHSFSPFQVDDSKLFKGITPPTSFSSWTTTHWKSLSLTDLPFWRSEKKNSTSVPLEFLPLDDFWKRYNFSWSVFHLGRFARHLYHLHDISRCDGKSNSTTMVGSFRTGGHDAGWSDGSGCGCLEPLMKYPPEKFNFNRPWKVAETQ